jgi:hypothetical protein
VRMCSTPSGKKLPTPRAGEGELLRSSVVLDARQDVPVGAEHVERVVADLQRAHPGRAGEVDVDRRAVGLGRRRRRARCAGRAHGRIAGQVHMRADGLRQCVAGVVAGACVARRVSAESARRFRNRHAVAHALAADGDARERGGAAVMRKRARRECAEQEHRESRQKPESQHATPSRSGAQRG